MRSFTKISIIASILILIGVLLYFPGRRFARIHVNDKTAVEDHPLLCTSCHLHTNTSGLVHNLMNEQYLSPYNLAISEDGKRIFVVAQEGNLLIVVDAENRKNLKKIKLGERPHSVVLNHKQDVAYVSNQWADNVYIIDLDSYLVVDTLRTGNGPAGMTISPDDKFLYVVNSYSSDISVFELDTGREMKRLLAGNNPVAADMSPDGEYVFVSSRRTLPIEYNTPPMTELTIAETKSQRVSQRIIFEGAYIMENVSFTPSGDFAIATLIRPKNLIPSVQVERGWMMTHGIGIVEMTGKKRIIQLLTDEPNSYYPDPFDIAISPDGKRAYVSHSGVDHISVLDLEAIRKLIRESSDDALKMYSNHLGISSKYVLKRIPTGANPKGLVLSPDGKKLYVAERLEDRIGIINTENFESEKPIDLGGPRRITVARKGRRLFNNAGHTFQNQYACYTCHPDAHEDGLVYNMAGKDMGRNLANVQTLRDIGKTPPFKWNGKNQTIYKQDGIRFSTILTRTESFTYKELDALVAYIATGIQNPPNLMYNPTGELTEAQLRGKEVFERTHDNFGNLIPEENRCITCHPPPYYTNMQMVDVGTLSDTDDPMLFDTPQLNNIYASPPYLHDGRAAPLEELWTKYNDEDKHGVGNDMLKDQLNDLVEYLKSLRDARYHDIEY